MNSEANRGTATERVASVLPKEPEVTDPELSVHDVLSRELRDWMTAELRYPVLAIITPSGAPNQSVMWFDLDPEDHDTIVMNTRVGRAKERWLRDDPRVSLLFEDGLVWYAMQGTIEFDDDRERALADIKALARRYDSNPEKFNGQERATLRMKVEKVIAHDR
jgi:PPOX class probable F420-dependent enzyme